MSLKDFAEKTNIQTTTTISYIILFVFCGLVLLIYFHITSDSKIIDDEGKLWFDLFKYGFVILGGALTTLIGYYFGKRGSDLVLDQAEKLNKESEEILKSSEENAPTTNEETEDINPIQP